VILFRVLFEFLDVDPQLPLPIPQLDVVDGFVCVDEVEVLLLRSPHAGLHALDAEPFVAEEPHKSGQVLFVERFFIGCGGRAHPLPSDFILLISSPSVGRKFSERGNTSPFISGETLKRIYVDLL